MSEPITDKQLGYMNGLLKEHLGETGRKVWLEEEYGVESSKELTKSQASDVISLFAEESDERKKALAEAEQMINEAMGQKQMF